VQYENDRYCKIQLNMFTLKLLHIFYQQMVTNIAGLQMQNNINVINKFSNRCAFQYFVQRQMFLFLKNAQNCVKYS